MPMPRPVRDALRGVVGGLLLGLPLLFTMETWWLGWRLPAWQIAVFDLVGLAVVLGVVRQSGFKEAEDSSFPGPLALAVDVAELFLQVFLAGLLVLLLFDVVDLDDPPAVIARSALLQVVPLGLGAAIANHVLRASEQGEPEPPFPKDVAIAAGGALFFTLPIAPTEELELMAARAGPLHLALAVPAALLVAYAALYVLEFRGHHGRTRAGVPLDQVGATALVYGIAFATAYLLAAAYGHFDGQPLYVQAQLTIVLAFAATLGASAARVVL